MNITQLPSDIICFIAEILNSSQEEWNDKKIDGIVDIVYLSMTCKRLYTILSNEELWKKFYTRDLSKNIPSNIKKRYYVASFDLREGILYEIAAECGYEVIIYQMDKTYINRDLIIGAITNNHFEIFDYLYDNVEGEENDENERKTLDEEICNETIERGNIKTIVHLRENNFKLSGNLLSISCSSGNMETTKYLHEIMGYKFNKNSLDKAVKGNNLELIKYVFEIIKPSPIEVDESIHNSKTIDIFKYLWEYSNKKISSLRMLIEDKLYNYGSENFEQVLELIKFEDNCGKTFDINNISDKIIKRACQSGKLEDVKWLFEEKGIKINKGYGNDDFITPLMLAYINGRKDIVEYLIEKGVMYNQITQPILKEHKDKYLELYDLIHNWRKKKNIKQPVKLEENLSIPRG
jgi:hypothetical protein